MGFPIKVILELRGTEYVGVCGLFCLFRNFACLLSSTDFFFKINFLEKFLQEYHHCQTDWIQVRSDILSGLIWVQTVCKRLSADDTSRLRVK